MKKAKKKRVPVSVKKLFPILILVAAIFMGIGYASVNSISLSFSGDAIAKEVDGVFITEINYISDVNANLEQSKILNAYQTNMNSNIVLSNIDSNSSITYEVTIYNSSDSKYIFEGVEYLISDETYSNEGITFNISLNEGDIVDSKESITFTIVFNYSNNQLTENNSLLSLLNFKFVEYITAKITFDYNYLPNDQFENYYDTSSFKSCCESGQYFISTERIVSDDGVHYVATRYPSFEDEWDRGYFFSKIDNPLSVGVDYTLMFDAKGSEEFSAIIGSEQGGEKSFDIYTEWNRYTYTFTATLIDSLLIAFVVYDWGGVNQRTLDLRNVQIQQGNLYTDSLILRSGVSLGNNLFTPSRDGWSFLGWYTLPVGGTLISNDTLVPYEDVTYYAQWKYVG